MSFELARDLMDPLKNGPEHVLRQNRANPSVQPATVLSFDAVTNTAYVRIHNAGSQAIRLPIKTSYQGERPGTGQAISLWPGQLVHVHLENGQGAGLQARGYIDLAYFTADDHFAPVAASWWQNPNGKVEVYPGPENTGLGDVEHIDHQGHRAQVKISETSLEDWSSTSVVVTGPNETQNAKKTKEAAKKAGEAFNLLKD